MRFDLVDLSLFRHVVDAGSITHGAERAHLALAAASRVSATWNRRLGAAASARPRRSAPDTGRAYAASMPYHASQAERLREDLGAYAGGLAGSRVLSNTNALTEFLPGNAQPVLTTTRTSRDLEEKLSDEIVG